MFIVLSSWPWSLQEFTWFNWWMQTECQVAANPQTKPTDLGCESANSVGMRRRTETQSHRETHRRPWPLYSLPRLCLMRNVNIQAWHENEKRYIDRQINIIQAIVTIITSLLQQHTTSRDNNSHPITTSQHSRSIITLFLQNIVQQKHNTCTQLRADMWHNKMYLHASKCWLVASWNYHTVAVGHSVAHDVIGWSVRLWYSHICAEKGR